ncbi:MAG: TraR/DksA family transcriptional regulator [Deltaproteobacteria bacterium]|nr:TraR/DksA family transcriptional regulator [Deltaproteobacteria bacterium]MBW1922703.1 TraR/DksA family transcriptional regulator [Deltaproteobacteria bacterium]MBW1948145.1 TraR/DksA family transcriptional regulator [Deltaproteobacteria bacterium]MBW2347104.1 TraR/DksA family transcriptional regulator [Deltaproteobacteria bacterium]
MSDDRENFIDALLKKKEDTETALRRLLEAQKESTSQMSEDLLSDEFDSAQREVAVQAQYRLIEKKTEELKRIDRLILQVRRDEDFGICEECGEPIPPARLLIVPDSTLCVTCQQEAEKVHRARSVSLQAPSLPGRKQWEWEQDADSGLPDLEDDSLGDGLEIFEFEEDSQGGPSGMISGIYGDTGGEDTRASAM